MSNTNVNAYKIRIEALSDYLARNVDVYRKMSGATTKFICFMGIGKIFSDELWLYKRAGYKIDLLCDNDPRKWGQKYYGYRCVSPTDLSSYGNDVAVIVAVGNYQPICDQLRGLGINNVHPSYEWMRDDISRFHNSRWGGDVIETIKSTIELLEDDISKVTYLTVLENKLKVSKSDVNYSKIAVSGDEYFQDDIFLASDKECFVDAGSFVGDTLNSLLKRTGNKLDKAFLFELELNNFNACEKYIKTLPKSLQNRIKSFNKGLYNQSQTVHYEGAGDGFSISPSNISNDCKAEVVALDDILYDEKVTFIKMDIEGSEIPALEGAKNIIANQRPKLAISTYHQLKDLLEIPLIIHKSCPDYKIFLRHHRLDRYSTVCYARL